MYYLSKEKEEDHIIVILHIIIYTEAPIWFASHNLEQESNNRVKAKPRPRGSHSQEEKYNIEKTVIIREEREERSNYEEEEG